MTLSSGKKRNNLEIISGGQTGVERAALDFALCNNLNCSGWCKLGRKADDGKIPLRYPLHEAFSENEINRILQNMLASDGILIIVLLIWTSCILLIMND